MNRMLPRYSHTPASRHTVLCTGDTWMFYERLVPITWFDEFCSTAELLGPEEPNAGCRRFYA